MVTPLRKEDLKIGLKVSKARPYNKNYSTDPEGYCSGYCCYGGDEDEVPIGTLGEITSFNKDNMQICVQFKNGVKWSVDISELDNVDFKEITFDKYSEIKKEKYI